MQNNRIAILTVIYHENEHHYNMALETWRSMPKDAEILAVFNKRYWKEEYPDNITYIKNDENCLSRAWNKGLRILFKKYKYVFVSNLDLQSPKDYEMEEMIQFLEDNPDAGIIAPSPLGFVSNKEFVEHGDGSFSFFLISKDCFEKVGDFDERYKPAYFEDNDYLERCWKNGFKPKKYSGVSYYHLTQGTIKLGEEIRSEYSSFMNKNLELFRKTYGKTPDHLPNDIVFR